MEPDKINKRHDIISKLENVISPKSEPAAIDIQDNVHKWIERNFNVKPYNELFKGLKLVAAIIKENEAIPTHNYWSEKGSFYYLCEIKYFGKARLLPKAISINIATNTIITISYHEDDTNIIVSFNEEGKIVNTIESQEVQESIKYINENIQNFNNNNATNGHHEIADLINTIDIPGFLDLVYTPFFSMAFECVCRSVLSGEYAMDDSFSNRLRDLAKCLLPSSGVPKSGSSSHFFSQCAVALSQILDAYNLLCIQTDAQVDKDPSLVLGNMEEYYGYHEYEDYLNKFLSNQSNQRDNKESGFLYVNPLLVHFFQAFLNLARIDQNFYYSKDCLYKLLYLKELLNDSTNVGKGIWRVWEKYHQDVDFLLFDDLKEMLHLTNLKNEYLIKKILGSCSFEVKDLTYVGQSKVFVFNPRKCQDIERGNADQNRPELLLYKRDDSKVHPEIKQIISLYSKYCQGGDNLHEFDDYEKKYIDAIHQRNEKDEKNSIEDYYNKILSSQTSRTSKDIRHYNTKVLEMARDAIFDTAEIRCWIKHHRHDFNEEEGFNQIKKVLLFVQNRYEDNHVCYDYETLVEYSNWCISFLEIVATKTPIHGSDRPSQIEEALLLIETLNRLIDKLINSIEGKQYSLPYASKFRGCFFYYKTNVPSNSKTEVSHSLIRVFAGQSQSDDKFKPERFESFISAKKEFKEVRKSIIFIASSYIPPLNYEKLKTQREELKAKTQKLRNEIHAQYFNRLREYIKEDSEKQLEDNRRSVVQILGIFAAFLALTTVALTGAVSSKETTIPFHTIMLSFSLCISVFVALIYLISYSRAHRKMELRLHENKIYQQWLHDEINKTISIIKREFSVQKDNNDQLLANVQKSIKELLEELQNCNSNINIENTGLKNTFQEINILLNKIQDNLSNFQINAKPTKRKCIYKHFLSTKRNISPSERIINDLLKNVTRIKELTIKDKFSTIHERIKDLEQVRILENNIQKTCDNIQKIIPKKNAPRKTRLNFAEQLLIIVILILLGGTIISICYYEKKESYPPQHNNNTTRTDDNRDCDLTFSNNQTIHVLQMNQDNKKNVHE